MKRVWERKIEELLNSRTKDEELIFFRILSLLLYSREKDELATLYREIGKDSFSRVIDAIGGQTVSVPSREDYKDVNLVAFCFYLKEMKGMTWSEIHEVLPFDNINSVKYGKWIARLSRDIKEEITSAFESLQTEVKIEDFF